MLRSLICFISAILLFTYPVYAQSLAKAEAGCVISGCSAEMCLDADKTDITGTCEWKDEYICYAREGVCKKQADGKCGWEQSESMKVCLKNPPQTQDVPAVPE